MNCLAVFIFWDHKITDEIINHHLLCVPHPVSASVGPSSAVLASQFHEQTQPPHQHSTAATKEKAIKRGTFFKRYTWKIKWTTRWGCARNNEKHEQTCRLANSFIWLTGNQARYVSVVRHHRGTPTMMTTAAMDRAASWPRLRSERHKETVRQISLRALLYTVRYKCVNRHFTMSFILWLQSLYCM